MAKTVDATTSTRNGSALTHSLPILSWLPAYDRSVLRFDVIAAVTVAAFSVPESMAYAGLAGLSPQVGLYAGMAAPIAYALFGTSRQLGIGPTSALSILVASSIGGMAAGDTHRYAALAMALALMVGLVSVIARLARLGFLVNFISESVLVGFSAGAALYIGSTQLGKLFGIEGSSGSFFERVSFIARHIGETNGWTLAVGVVGIAALFTGERLAPRLPWSLVVVLAGIVLLSVTNLESRGVAIVGNIPRGLPAPALPDVSLGDLNALLPSALALFLLAYVEGMGSVQAFARKHQYRADANQELLALGASNLASGLFQAFPVGGSLSRSAVMDGAGGQTQFAGFGTGVLVGAVALFLTGLFHNLPEAILGAVVIMAVRGLFNVKALRRLARVSRFDFWIALASLAGVLVFGVLDGVLIGAIFSLLILIWHASRPHAVVLGRVPGSESFSDLQRHPENEVIPDVLIYRVESGLFYANGSGVKDNLEMTIEALDRPPKLVVFDLSSSPMVDLAAIEMLVELNSELLARGIELRLADVNGPTRDLIRRAEPDSPFGTLGPGMAIGETIARWRAEPASLPRLATSL